MLLPSQLVPQRETTQTDGLRPVLDPPTRPFPSGPQPSTAVGGVETTNGVGGRGGVQWRRSCESGHAAQDTADARFWPPMGPEQGLGGASDAVRAPCGRRADAVRIVGTVAVWFESGRLQERLKQLKWQKWLFRGSVLYQMD